jgi:hypothetical protein
MQEWTLTKIWECGFLCGCCDIRTCCCSGGQYPWVRKSPESYLCDQCYRNYQRSQHFPFLARSFNEKCSYACERRELDQIRKMRKHLLNLIILAQKVMPVILKKQHEIWSLIRDYCAYPRSLPGASLISTWDRQTLPSTQPRKRKWIKGKRKWVMK